ncbi:MAG: hypothetical protein Q8J68_09420 [Methanolobus sp.]|uniref:hypothetical protein n=1 Tax=Methanolobus sp. TaxID=1874737 RepID=UPI0027320793|nr:hypothetical protein [Methanolobus sp.]MDP2217492.1 hypothetical protein [Methanolobus sp.]
MYIKTPCYVCGEKSFHYVKVHHRIVFLGDRKISWVTSADVTDTCSPEELAASVLHELSNHVYNGITTNELCKILREKFGVLEQYCCDIVQLLKIRMHMYCPDRQHLYFVDA